MPPAALADTVTVARGDLSGRDPVLGGLATVIDRVDHEVLQRIGDTVEHLLVELDVLSYEIEPHVLAGRARDIAHQPREGGDHPTHRHHRQAHRAVAHQGEPTTRVFDQRAQLMPRLLHLVGHGHDVVDGIFDVARQTRTTRCHRVAQRPQPTLLVGGKRNNPFGVLLDSARVELSLTDHVEQVVNPLRGDPHRVDRAFVATIDQE